MTHCKLTNGHDLTYGRMQWGPGVTHRARGKGKALCSDGWIHYYASSYLAVLMNSIGGHFIAPHGWAFKPGRIRLEDGAKSGCKSGTTIKRIDLPRFSREQHIAFAITVARDVYRGSKWHAWAEAWLSGADRSADSAQHAKHAARSPNYGRVQNAAAHEAAAHAAAAAYSPTDDAVAHMAACAASAAQDHVDLVALAQQAYEWVDPMLGDKE